MEPKPTQPLKVLFVEDFAEVARPMIQMIQSLGHKTKWAGTVQDAVEAGKGDDYDVLLCDFSLPDGTGLDVLRKLKPNGPPRSILMTAYGSLASEPCLEGGFSRCLEKPVSMDDLRALLGAVQPASV